jgi:hypothetical protein
LNGDQAKTLAPFVGGIVNLVETLATPAGRGLHFQPVFEIFSVERLPRPHVASLANKHR